MLCAFWPSTEPSVAVLHHVGHKFHEVFQLKQGRYADLPATKISEMMKSNSLDVSFRRLLCFKFLLALYVLNLVYV